MTTRQDQGRANLTAIAVLAGLLITGVWIWKRLPVDQQEQIIDQAVPVALGVLALGLLFLAVIGTIRRRARQRRELDRLVTAFSRETTQDKKLDISFAIIECNGYRIDGLEEVTPELKELWGATLERALGDKQHRVRGMAASHLGVLQDKSTVPLLMKALEDDHAYVRACAALGLGRLRASEARERLVQLATDDGDQTVRGRAREALDQIRNATP